MCVWCLYGGEGLSDERLPHEPDTTFVFPSCLKESLTQHIDWESSEYLPRLVQAHFPKSLVPLRTTGDGNCLLNAVSRVVYGVEVYWKLLRQCIATELEEHLEWYQSSKEFQQLEWEEGLKMAKKFGTDLNFSHIFALANALKRPIIMYASDADIMRFGTGESGVAATFVPARHPPSVCNTTPIYLSWGSSRKNHYVPLLGIEGQPFPALPVFPVGFPSLVKQEDMLLYINQHGQTLKHPPIMEEMKTQFRLSTNDRHNLTAEELLLSALARSYQNRIANPTRSASSSSSWYNRKELESSGDGTEDWFVFDRDDENDEFQDGSLRVVELPDGTRYITRDTKRGNLRESDEAPKELSSHHAREEMLEYYDHVFTIKIHEGLYLNIGHRKGDTLEETVDRFLKDNELPVLYRSDILRFLAANIPFEDRTPLAMSMIPKREPMYYSRLNNKPNPSEDFDRLLAKLLEFNSNLIAEPSLYALTDAEISELRGIVELLKKGSITPPDLQTADLTPPQYATLYKILRWRKEHLFPALDMLRLLIIIPKVAASLSTKMDVLNLMLQLSAGEDKLLSMLSCKFIANMFASPSLKAVAMRYTTKILQTLLNVAIRPTTAPIVRSCLVSIVLNYSIELCDRFETKRKTFLGGVIHQLVRRAENDQQLLILLVAFGNLLWKDKASKETLCFVALAVATTCTLILDSKLRTPEVQTALHDQIGRAHV